MNNLEQAKKILSDLERDYLNVKRERDILMEALESIAETYPECPNDYYIIRKIVRKAINECD